MTFSSSRTLTVAPPKIAKIVSSGALRCRTLREVELEATEKRQPDNLLTRVDGAPVNLVPTENG
jgi:hypothetical protein